jgi:outer membrane protein assembly factor BamB
MIKFLVFSFVFILSLFAQDFSQWRGPDRNGKYPANNLLKSWPKEGPQLLWSFDELGAGHSSPAIANDRIYITGMPEDQGVLYCFDMDGKLFWKTTYGPEWTKNYPGPRSAPAIKDSHLYIISGKGHLYCFDAFKGNKIWSIDLLAKFNSQNIEWGMAESVIIHNDMVIATPGGSQASVVALNRFTGETVWTCPGNGDMSAYCSQQLVNHNGLDLIIAMTTESIMGIDANSGDLYWRVKQTQDYHIHANTPIYHQGKIFCISGSNESTSGSVMLQLSKDGKSVTELWRNNDIENLMGGVVLHNGYIFGSRYEKQQWYCLDWKSGNLKYISKELGKGAIIFADELFYCYSEKGVLALVDADQKKFDIISSFKIRKGRGPHWSHPVILNDRLYLRHGGVLMMYDVANR